MTEPDSLFDSALYAEAMQREGMDWTSDDYATALLRLCQLEGHESYDQTPEAAEIIAIGQKMDAYEAAHLRG